MEYKNIIKSEKFKKTFIGLGILLAILVVFQAGVEAGYRKATFSSKFGDNYRYTFGEHRPPMMGGPKFMMMIGEDLPNFHGALGKIIKIETSTMVILDRDGTEKVVLINDKTVARRFRENIDIKSLKIDDDVIIIGSPNDKSQVEAKLIRLMVPPPEFMGTTTRK